MSTESVRNQLETNFNNAVKNISQKNAVMDTLIYSNVFDGNVKIGNDGNPLSLGKQFYKTDGNGNFVTNTDGSYIIRKGLDADTTTYLKQNPTLVNQLDQYTIAKTANETNGFVGAAIVNTNTPKEVIFLNRGTEPTVTDITTDVILGINEYNPISDIPNMQVNSAKIFADSILKSNGFTSVQMTGHSLGGYLAVQQAAYVINTFENITVTQVDTFNAPQATNSIENSYGDNALTIMQKLQGVTQTHIALGDVVSKVGTLSDIYGDNVIGQVNIYHTTVNNPLDHGIGYFSDINKSTFNTTYLNNNGTLDTIALAEKLSVLSVQTAALEQSINDGDYGFWDQLENRLGIADVDNPYAKLDAIKVEQQGLQNMLGGISGYVDVANNYENIKFINDFMIESVGGEQGESLLQAIANSILEQPTQESQQQFINSLKESGLVEGMMNMADGSDSLSNNADYIQQFANKALNSTGGTVMDPLVLDLNNNGIETVAADGSVMFDHNADGVKRGTGWAGADDGLLVRDLDGNGSIDSGRELFGDNTLKSDGTIATDGFDALSDLDSNADGVFDASDTAFDEVKVWQDANQDGISQSDELMSLAEAGVASINLDGQSTTTVTDGGVISKTGSFTRTDGTSADIGNLDFNQNAIYREFIEKLDTSEIIGRIDLAGFGHVRSLKETATLNENLYSLIQNFESDINYSAKVSLADEVLLSWARTSENFSSKLDELENIVFDDGTKIVFEQGETLRSVFNKTIVFEAFSAERFFDYDLVDNGNSYTLSINVGENDINTHGVKAEYTFNKGSTLTLGGNSFTFTHPYYRALQSGYGRIKDLLMKEVFYKTEYSQILEKVGFSYNVDNGVVNLELSEVKNYLYSQMVDDFNSGKELFEALGKYVGDAFEGNMDLDLDSFIREAPESVINQISANNVENLFVSNHKFQSGTSVRDIIYGSDEGSTIDGRGGDDLLIGGSGNDIIKGGVGRDYLRGGDGNDTLSSGSNGAYEWIEGGLGDDILISEYGSYANAYNYNLGDGLDTIKRATTSYSSTSTFNHKIRFGDGIARSDLGFFKDGSNLFVQVNNDINSGLILENYFNSDYRYKSMVSHIEFDDWNKLDLEDVDFGQVYRGVYTDSNLAGSEKGDIIIGKDSTVSFNTKKQMGKVSSTSIKGVFDINDDGLADIVEQQGDATFVSLANGNGFDERKEFDLDINLSNNSNDNITPEFYADINGDGRNDLVKFEKDGVYTAIGEEGGTFANSQKGHLGYGVNAGGWLSNDRYPRYLADVNGDGMADIIGFGGSYTFVALSKGDGTFSSQHANSYNGLYASFSTGFNYNDGWVSNSSHQRFLADVNGDGKADIVGIDGTDVYVATTNNDNDIITARAGNDTVIGGSGDDIITGGTGDDILRGEDGADTYIYAKGDGTDTINASSEDGVIDTLQLTDINHDEISLGKSGDDLEIYVGEENLLASVVDDYFTQKFNADRLEIDTSDDFQMQLWKNVQLIEEALEGMAADAQAENDTQALDTDGGSVDGTSQTSTKLDASDLADLWIPKNKDGF